MEPTRQAARQLAQQGLVDITQKGQVRLHVNLNACCSFKPAGHNSQAVVLWVGGF
jgi:hypothetical protein